MSTAPYQIGVATWNRVPGIMETIAKGQIDLAEPEQSRQAGLQLLSGLYDDPLPSGRRSDLATVELGSLQDTLFVRESNAWVEPSSWLRDLLRSIQGYRQDRVLIDHEPRWVPIVEIHAPRGGSVALRYTQSVQRNVEGAFKIFGSGLGATGTFTLEKTLEIPKTTVDKVISVQLIITVTSYVSPDGHTTIYPMNIENPDGKPLAIQIADLKPAARRPTARTLDLKRWNMVELYDLTKGTGAEPVRRAWSTSGQASWDVDLGLSLELPAKLDLTAKVSFTYSEDWVATYLLPYGHKYGLFARRNESPFVPLALRL